MACLIPVDAPGATLMSDRVIAAGPLTGEAFAPFGEVIAHEGDAARRYLRLPLARELGAGEPRFWVTRVRERAALPLRIAQLERHPYSAQSFIPLHATRYLVVAAGSDARGLPDIGTMRAFIAAPHQGVCYRPGMWHHRLTALDTPAEFAVIMSMTGRDDDDAWHDLAVAVQVIDLGGGDEVRHGCS